MNAYLNAMPQMNADIYDAFKAANVPEDQARAAAVSVVAENEIPEIKNDVQSLQADMTIVKSDTRLMKWMLPLLRGVV